MTWRKFLLSWRGIVTLRYLQRRLKGAYGGTTSINAPLQGFVGDNFEIGVGPMKTTFVVSKPPHREGDAWKMNVDGIELTKTD